MRYFIFKYWNTKIVCFFKKQIKKTFNFLNANFFELTSRTFLIYRFRIYLKDSLVKVGADSCMKSVLGLKINFKRLLYRKFSLKNLGWKCFFWKIRVRKVLFRMVQKVFSIKIESENFSFKNLGSKVFSEKIELETFLGKIWVRTVSLWNNLCSKVFLEKFLFEKFSLKNFYSESLLRESLV